MMTCTHVQCMHQSLYSTMCMYIHVQCINFAYTYFYTIYYTTIIILLAICIMHVHYSKSILVTQLHINFSNHMIIIHSTVRIMHYKERLCQRYLNYVYLNHNIITLHTFVDSFTDCYRDGTEPGTRYYRYFAVLFLLLRIFQKNIKYLS